MQADLTRAKIQGALTIPADFSRRLAAGKDAPLQLITDGANINQVGYTKNYVSQIAANWLQNSRFAPQKMPPSKCRHAISTIKTPTDGGRWCRVRWPLP